ncbi:MAG: response regulator [Desulfobacula sp.]|uniref:hybrid sensor histidine kinase/response regulator n=1 Tax=Desulfobacula sp. TaxID=2593537 RepID=UPI0025BF145A|nr:response regulator [Desulfobacula sp.]MCD4722108.1 response regulator [Desulfobacula sp.]
MTIFKKIIISPLLLTLMYIGIFIFFYNQISIVIDFMSKEAKTSSMAVKQVHMDSIFQLMELTKEISFNPLLGPEPAELTIILSQLMQYAAIQSAYFVDTDERVLADGTPHSDLQAPKLIGQPIPDEMLLDIKHDIPIFEIIDNQLVYSHPFDDQGDPIGRLQVIISLDKLNKIQSDLLDKEKIITKKSRDKIRAIMMGTIAVIILSFFIAVLFIRRIITNLNLAVDVAKKVSEGNLDIQFEITSMDETGTLLTAMQAMVNNVRQANKTLEKSEEKYRNIFERAIEGLFQITQEDSFISVNHSMAHMFGYDSPEDLISTITDIAKQCHVNPADYHKTNDIIQEKGYISGTEIRFLRKDGSMFWGTQTVRAIRDVEGEFLYYEGSLVDITERMEKEKLEIELFQSRKMEAIGTLAGGVAHDFNNILSGIFGYSELAKRNIENPVKAKGHIGQIIKGAKRAAELIQQILAFSRQTKPEKHLLNISIVVKEALKLLRSSIPATIEIRKNILSDATILADGTQIHQVIMNLCINAYHAMRGDSGGILSIELKETQISDQDNIFDLNILSGKYLKLEVSDTGHGMDEEILREIFNPYFTTKKVGEGNGLGLALVYGIVKEHGGYVKVHSILGKGSTFHIFFPISDKKAISKELTNNSKPIACGTERIMVVDDDESILLSTKELLKDYGYKVSTFSNGAHAFKEFENNPFQFDLIITDMTMPQMAGDELSKRILNIRDDLPIILCTGYSENISELKALILGIKKYIQKPISSQNLLLSIREVLDEKNNKHID